MIDKAQLLADLKAARKQGLLPMVVRIGKGDGTTINATSDTGEQYTVWARTEDNGDPLVVYFTPGRVSYSWLAYGAEMEVERNDRNQLEITRPYTGLRDALGGAPLPTNAYDWIHTHESDVEAGQLNASLIFDEGTVEVLYGGTGRSSVTSGRLLLGAGTSALTELAPGTSGNVVQSNGTTFVSSALDLDTAQLSGTLALARGGTNADLSATGAGHLIQATTGANVSVIRDNFAGTAAPTTGDDSGDGYAIGSLWFDTTNDNVYVAIDVSVGAAVWLQINGSGTNYWTEDSGLLYPNNTGDNVTIGGTSNIAKLGIIGTDNEPQFIVRGNGTQTNNIFDVQNSTPSSLLKVTSSAIVFNDDSLDLDFRVESDGDANALFVDGGNGRVGLGTASPSARLDIVGSADVRQLRVQGATGQFANPVVELLDETGAFGFTLNNDGSLFLDGNFTSEGQFAHQLGAFIVNETGGNYDSRFEGDTDANLLFLDASADSVGIGTNAPTDWLHLKASTAARASLRIPAGTAPTSPNDGTVWKVTARPGQHYDDGMLQSEWRRIYSQYSTVGGSNTTSAINLIGGTAIGSATIASGMWAAGRSFRIVGSGYFSTGGVSRNISMTLALGGTTLVSQTISGISVVTAGRFWRIEADVSCRTVSSSGTVFSQGFGWLFQTMLDRLENTGTTTHNMTGSLAFTLTAQFNGANSDTQFQCTNLDIYTAA